MSRKLRAVLCAVVPAVVLALAVPASSSAAVDMFLELDGIEGESSSVHYPGAIDVLAWSWGASREANKPPNLQNISVTKYVDQSSPVLFSRLTTGVAIPAGTLTVVKPGTPPAPYLRLCMTGLRVTSISTGGSGGEDRLTENVSLSFSTIVMAYQRQKADGTLGPLVSAGWNLVDKIQFGEPDTHDC
jgi:type VI secretion system secreted protein Hcp